MFSVCVCVCRCRRRKDGTVNRRLFQEWELHTNADFRLPTSQADRTEWGLLDFCTVGYRAESPKERNGEATGSSFRTWEEKKKLKGTRQFFQLNCSSESCGSWTFPWNALWRDGLAAPWAGEGGDVAAVFFQRLFAFFFFFFKVGGKKVFPFSGLDVAYEWS